MRSAGSSRPPRSDEAAAGWRARLPRPPALPPLLAHLPGAAQRRRALALAALAGLVLLLRPWPPFQWLPGWVVGLLLLAAVEELLRWLWWPRRWR
ncbi:MAG: hypothetical protein VKJ05_04975 [Synechococcaceae cyanobacterium]|nr:hypothetical protein [Synechococcaceae cyanobacterium]